MEPSSRRNNGVEVFFALRLALREARLRALGANDEGIARELEAQRILMEVNRERWAQLLELPEDQLPLAHMVAQDTPVASTTGSLPDQEKRCYDRFSLTLQAELSLHEIEPGRSNYIKKRAPRLADAVICARHASLCELGIGPVKACKLLEQEVKLSWRRIYDIVRGRSRPSRIRVDVPGRRE